ncbi:MAG TPA: Na+/H+ antiporter subunit E [Candidatus Binatia bacterium]|jgi:multicomponent Na+:H+ antiporter subunit E
MTGLLWNIILALAWAGMTQDFTPSNLLIGFLLGLLVLFFGRRVVGTPNYLIKVRQVIGLYLFMIWELILANLRVAFEVLTPNYNMRPGVIAIPLDAKTDAEITLLACLITLTPGTLSLDVAADRSVLYIHIMYIDHNDIEAARRTIKEGYERRVLEVLR